MGYRILESNCITVHDNKNKHEFIEPADLHGRTPTVLISFREILKEFFQSMYGSFNSIVSQADGY